MKPARRVNASRAALWGCAKVSASDRTGAKQAGVPSIAGSEEAATMLCSSALPSVVAQSTTCTRSMARAQDGSQHAERHQHPTATEVADQADRRRRLSARAAEAVQRAGERDVVGVVPRGPSQRPRLSHHVIRPWTSDGRPARRTSGPSLSHSVMPGRNSLQQTVRRVNERASRPVPARD